MTSLRRLICAFRKDQRGNIAVTFAIACVPLLAAIGCAVDYTIAVAIRSKMLAAADAASVGSVSKASPAFIAAAAMPGDGAIAVGVTDATNIFNANLANLTGYTLNSATPVVTKTGTKITSVVSFSASVPTTFLGLIGKKTLTIGGSSTSQASLPPYLDYYLMLDVSGSMGLPSTEDEQTRLASVNPDNYTLYPTGCVFACHFAVQNVCTDSTEGYPTNNYCLGYAISRVSQSGYKKLLQTDYSNPMKKRLPSWMISSLPSSLYSSLTPVTSCSTDGTDACIQLRADAVGYAVTQLFITANKSATVTNQFRIGLYPFIQYLYEYFPLTTAINGSATNSSTINYAAANLATLLDTNTNSNLGSGGTHIDTALTKMNDLIKTVGDGTSPTSTQPFVFLVTDGAQDPQTKALNQSGGWAGSNHATVIDPTQQCQTMKNRGIQIGVLYIPYQPIQNPNPSFANDEDDYANNNIPSIPPSLQGCASPNFFFTANTPADITAALNAMFTFSLQRARITN